MKMTKKKVDLKAVPEKPVVIDGVNLGDLLHAAGNRDGAIASIRHALALDPGHAAAYSSLLASQQMEKGDTDEARALFKQAIQLASSPCSSQ